MKKFLSFFLCAFCVSSASMLGLDALGEEQIAGGVANVSGRGYAGGAKTGEAEGLSVVNPARFAFDTKVVFNLNFLIDFVTIENDVSFSTTSISLPSLNASIPMGNYGTMGVGLWQHYSSNLNESIDDSLTNSHAKVKYQGSIYEIVPTYAVRIPFFRMLSLGASAHIVMGSIERSLTLGADNSAVSKEDSWATNNADIVDYVSGSWEVKNHPAYYTFALQYRGRATSYFFSFTTPHTLMNNLDYNMRFSELDSLIPTHYVREARMPALLATGLNFKFLKSHNVMLDFQWRAFEDDVENIAGSWNMKDMTETQSDYLVSVGYQRDGSSLFYESFLKRMTYRAGAWMKSWYIQDVYEFGGSIGAGFPLGKKGTIVDLALQGGKRTTAGGEEWEEVFFGIRLGLMGVGTWGQTRSR